MFPQSARCLPRKGRFCPADSDSDILNHVQLFSCGRSPNLAAGCDRNPKTSTFVFDGAQIDLGDSRKADHADVPGQFWNQRTKLMPRTADFSRFKGGEAPHPPGAGGAHRNQRNTRPRGMDDSDSRMVIQRDVEFEELPRNPQGPISAMVALAERPFLILALRF